MHTKKHIAMMKKMGTFASKKGGVATIGATQTLPPPVSFQDPLAFTPTNVPGPLGIPGGLPAPGIPGGSLGFTVPDTVTQLARVAVGGCDSIPEGFLRDSCLAAAGFFDRGGPPALPAIPGGGGNGTSVGMAGVGAAPTLEAVSRFKCPDFLNGVGLLWINVNGEVTCLPRGVSGAPWGLVRKNPKRHKAFISHAEIKALKGRDKTKKKAKQFAKLAGLHTHSAHRPR